MTDAFAPRASELLETLRLGAESGATTAMVGQGIGPLSGAALMSQFRDAMTRVDMIALREGTFAPTLLARAGVDPQRVVVTGDDTIEAAYALRAGQLGTDIGINVRVADYSGVAPGQAQTVVAAAAELAAQHGSLLRQVVISRHEDEHDSEFMASAVLDAEGSTFQACMGAVNRCRVCIVGSYHAAVFSLSVGVPVVAIVGSPYYAQKFGGLAGQFDGGILLVQAGRPSSIDDMRTAAEHLWTRAPVLRPVLLKQARRQIAASSAAYEKLFDLVDERLDPRGS